MARMSVDKADVNIFRKGSIDIDRIGVSADMFE